MSDPLIPDVDEMSYDPDGTGLSKVVFDAFCHSRMSGSVVKDDSRRTTKWVEWMLEVQCRASWVSSINPHSTSDIVNLRQALTKQGGQLRYAGRGFDNTAAHSFTVNVPGGAYDANYGPVPEVLDYKPLGGGNAALIVWRVRFAIPECAGAKYFGPNAIAAFNYEETWIIEQGYTTIEYRGYIEIPLTRVTGQRIVLERADYYRDFLNAGPPALGFERVSPQRFHESADRRRLDFSWTDREMPAPLPDDCMACDCHQTLHSDMFGSGSGFALWQGTIRAAIILNPLLPKAFALDKFLLIVQSRLGFDQIGVFKGIDPTTGTTVRALLTSVDVDDDVFGRGSEFSIAYTIFGCTIETALGFSGMWQPIKGTSFQSWRTSVQVPMSVRGAAGVRQQLGGADAIIDLCLTRTDIGIHEIDLVEVPSERQELGTHQSLDDLWLTYVNAVYIKCENGVCLHKALNNDVQVRVVGFNAAGEPDQPGANSSIGQVTIIDKFPDRIQQRSTPNAVVVMEGYAMRLGMRIPVPYLESVGGVPCREILRQAGPELVIGNLAGIPIYWNMWYIEYALQEPPKEAVLISANPVYRMPSVLNSGNQVYTLTAQP